MRAVTVVPGQPDTAGVEDRPDPPPDQGAVVVEGLLMGVCGTDVEISAQGYGEPPPGARTLVLGHESLGRVRSAPDGVAVKAGDLVVGVVRRPDGCAACQAGQWDFCLDGNYTERGIKGRDGYGSSTWRVEPEFAVAVPAQLGDLAVLVEPTAVVAKAWEQVERIGARAFFEPKVVLVTGAGPVGLLAALLGVQRGLEVHVLDTVTGGVKPQLVADLGATYHHDGVAAAGVTPDVVVECTGVGEVVLQAVEHSAHNAIVALAGLQSDARTEAVALDALNKQMVLTNKVLFGSVNEAYRHYEQAAAALARADQHWLARLVTRRVPIGSWPEALQRGDDDVKVVIDLQA